MATGNTERNWWEARYMDSVGDLDPQDPHVFGLPDPDPLVSRVT